jgi:energy-coupling factor transporter ATP-binding protein EcfA2
MIKLSDFSFGYTDLLFRNIDMEISTSQITVLSGKTGVGKTTFLKILSGLITNFSGTILLKRTSLKILSIKQISKYLIYHKQEPKDNLVATTPYEDLKLWLFNEKKIDEKKIYNALKIFDLSFKKDTPVWQLSGGEAKKVGLSSLILFPEKYWLIDEPISGLDKNSREIFLNLLSNKKENKQGALIVTHNPEIFSSVADYFIILENGKFIKDEKFKR